MMIKWAWSESDMRGQSAVTHHAGTKDKPAIRVWSHWQFHLQTATCRCAHAPRGPPTCRRASPNPAPGPWDALLSRDVGGRPPLAPRVPWGSQVLAPEAPLLLRGPLHTEPVQRPRGLHETWPVSGGWMTMLWIRKKQITCIPNGVKHVSLKFTAPLSPNAAHEQQPRRLSERLHHSYRANRDRPPSRWVQMRKGHPRSGSVSHHPGFHPQGAKEESESRVPYLWLTTGSEKEK